MVCNIEIEKTNITYRECPADLPAIVELSESYVEKEKSQEDFAETDAKTIPSNVFAENRLIKEHSWQVPWFIATMCFLQISIYAIANKCLHQRLLFVPDHQQEYWRYLTYMLLHSDLLHLLLNACLQCLIRFCLENEQGHLKVALVYTGGGISGSLAAALFQPQVSLIGASAGVYAMLTSHIPHLLKNFAQLPHRYLRIVALVVLCSSDISFTTFHFLVNRNRNPRICLEAHIAGAFTGLMLGLALYSKGRGARWRQRLK